MSHESMATLSVSGNNEGGLKTTVNVRDLDGFIVDEPERLGGTNAGANPLEYFLGALSACTSIVLRYASRDEAFEYAGVDFNTEGTLDTRGFAGKADVQTYFQTIHLEVIIDTDESDERIQEMKTIVEKRCPLYNLANDANVNITSTWRKP